MHDRKLEEPWEMGIWDVPEFFQVAGRKRKNYTETPVVYTDEQVREMYPYTSLGPRGWVNGEFDCTLVYNTTPTERD